MFSVIPRFLHLLKGASGRFSYLLTIQIKIVIKTQNYAELCVCKLIDFIKRLFSWRVELVCPDAGLHNSWVV